MGNYIDNCCLSREKEPVDKDLASIRLTKQSRNLVIIIFLNF